MKKIIIGVIPAMLYFHGAIAEETISLEEAINIALKNNREYQIAECRTKVAKENINVSWGALLPALESEISLSRQKAESGVMALSDGQYDVKILQVRFGINPGNFYHTLQATRAQYIIATEELRKIKAEIELKVVKGYCDAILATELEKMKNDSLAVYAENLKEVKNLYKTGTVPKYELLQAQVQHKILEVQAIDAKSKKNLSVDYFNYYIGAKGKRYIPDSTILQKKIPVLFNDDAKIKNLVAIALKNRPEVLQLSLKKEMLLHKQNATASTYIWPTLYITGWYGKSKLLPNELNMGMPAGPFPTNFSTITGTDEWQKVWQIKVGATYRWGSLLPFDQTKSFVRQDEEEIAAANKELENLKEIITLSINASYSKLITSALSIDTQKESVALAEEGLRIARESYKAGIIKNSELIAAEYALTAAKTGLINSFYNYHVALAELTRELGISSDEIIFKEKQ
ncbi:MAG: TolC family protein [Spirochaetes bacterium]|nr:TolC family protein [Spirochaetota bacterium]